MATKEVVVAPAAEGEKVQSGINLFNRWSYDEIQIVDISVQDYITATAAQHPTYMPHTDGSLGGTKLSVSGRLNA
ncbi:ribosomal protein S5 [Orobanche gracilis]